MPKPSKVTSATEITQSVQPVGAPPVEQITFHEQADAVLRPLYAVGVPPYVTLVQAVADALERSYRKGQLSARPSVN